MLFICIHIVLSLTLSCNASQAAIVYLGCTFPKNGRRYAAPHVADELFFTFLISAMFRILDCLELNFFNAAI